MRVTYVQYAGLSLDMLKKVAPEEEYMIEPEMIIDIPDELYDRWVANYDDAIKIANELEEIMKEVKCGF